MIKKYRTIDLKILCIQKQYIFKKKLQNMPTYTQTDSYVIHSVGAVGTKEFF